MTSLWVILTAGAAVAGWAMLNVLGAERQRLLMELEARRAKTPPHPPGTAPERPAISKPRPADDKATGDAKSKGGKAGKGQGKSDKPHPKSGARR